MRPTVLRRDALHVAKVAEYSLRVLAAERASRRRLSADERARALAWYRIERGRLEGIAFDLRRARGRAMGDVDGLTDLTVIAAAATLSPATSWHLLVADLPEFLHAALEGDPVPPFATYGAQRMKAARIVREGRGVDAVTGPKVSAFARALAGDAAAVVVDRHAARIALGDDTVTDVALGELRAIQDGYRLAASRLGLAPAGLQALVWVSRVGFGGECGPRETVGAA